jgi:hypothetical protein
LADQRLGAFLNGGTVCLLLQVWPHDLIPDPAGGRIRDDPFYSLAGLDPHMSGSDSVILSRHHEEERTSISPRVTDFSLGPDTPTSPNGQGHVILALIPDAGQRHHHELCACRRFEPSQERLQCRGLTGLQQSSKVVHVSDGPRRNQRVEAPGLGQRMS